MSSLLQGNRDPGKGQRGYATFEAEEGGEAARNLPRASWVSRTLFSFATPLMELGATRQLESGDLWDLDPDNQADPAFEALDKAYKAHSSASAPLTRAFFGAYGFSIALCGLAAVFSAGCSLLAPVVLNHVISSFAAPVLDLENLVWWLSVFFAARLADAFLSVQMTYYLDLVALRVTAAIKALVFHKVLRRKLKSRVSASEKEVDIANLFSSDINSIWAVVHYINNLWVLPIQMVIVVSMLYWVLDIAAFAGLAVIAVSMAISYFVSKYEVGFFSSMMKCRDERMKVIKEVFSAIQTVKFNAWEDKFAAKIGRLRSAELKTLKDFLVICAAEAFVVWATPLMVSTTSFAVYVLVLKRTLTAARVFTAIALFNALRGPLQDFPNVIQVGMQALVSFKRIGEYLQLPEHFTGNVLKNCDDIEADVVVQVDGGTFSWSADPTTAPILTGVDISIKTGDFTVIHGEVGSGKSSLCSALLGEMEKKAGRVMVRGSVAYYSQQPWVQNMTVRENILFGKTFDNAKYQRILDACGLLQDLQAFPAGDSTEIGHNGINLSGGQKARVSLARACYSDADVFILDSPLAAVDAVVQSEIFNKCFCSLLEQKTIILVTHNPVVIDSEIVDCVIKVDEGIVSTHRKHSNSHHRRAQRLQLDSPSEVHQTLGSTAPDQHASGQLIQDEKREEGRVSKHVFWIYFQALGGLNMCALVIITQLLWQTFQIGSDLWLTHWTNEVTDTDQKTHASKDMMIYAALAGAGALMVFVRSVSVVLVGIRGARHLFDVMTAALLRAPMRFFDANPIGRITNRYSTDIMSIDVRMPLIYGGFLADFFVTVCQLTTAIATINLLGVLVIPLAWMYVRVAEFYLSSSREVNRLRRVSNSPVLNFVSQCEEGLDVIRAFGPACIQHMVAENSKRLDAASKVLFAWNVTEKWYIVRVQLIGCGVVMGIVSALVYLRAAISPGLVGLAFSYALSVDAGLANLVRQWSYVEIIMVSPERVMEYASIESEGQRQSLLIEQSESWPHRGVVEFDKVVSKCMNDGTTVLKNVTFSIQDKEKIGVVGRSGAGQFSLPKALLRFDQLVSGRILIDGVDISTLPLKTLRSRVSCILRQPVVLECSVREYVDPFDNYTDQQIRDALAVVGLNRMEEPLNRDLDVELTNYYRSERNDTLRLVCLARAVLSQSRIVVVEDAVDAADHVFREKVNRVLKDATVLLISNSVGSSLAQDRVLVLNEGKVVGFDSPSVLAKNENGVFYHLSNEEGCLDESTKRAEIG